MNADEYLEREQTRAYEEAQALQARGFTAWVEPIIASAGGTPVICGYTAVIQTSEGNDA